MATEIQSPSKIPQALPPELHPDVEHLVTEDDTPVDNVFSEKQQRLLTEPLYSSPGWVGKDRKFIALANVGLFYAIRQPPYVPDMLLSLDVELPADLWPKSHRSYFVWEYGKPPDVVVEVVSNEEGRERSEKLGGYARIGVRYYVIYDPQRMLDERAVSRFPVGRYELSPDGRSAVAAGCRTGAAFVGRPLRRSRKHLAPLDRCHRYADSHRRRVRRAGTPACGAGTRSASRNTSVQRADRSASVRTGAPACRASGRTATPPGSRAGGMNPVPFLSACFPLCHPSPRTSSML